MVFLKYAGWAPHGPHDRPTSPISISNSKLYMELAGATNYPAVVTYPNLGWWEWERMCLAALPNSLAK